ncbi:hypothetical protein [Halobacillus sp. B29]
MKGKAEPIVTNPRVFGEYLERIDQLIQSMVNEEKLQEETVKQG